jgi:hypothetical protein
MKRIIRAYACMLVGLYILSILNAYNTFQSIFIAAAYAQECCPEGLKSPHYSSSGGECQMVSGCGIDQCVPTPPAGCNPAEENACYAQGRIWDADSCSCSGCSAADAIICNNQGKVIDPNTCLCIGCDPAVGQQCNALGGVFDPNTCTCTQNPCAYPQWDIEDYICYSYGDCDSCYSAFLCNWCEFYWVAYGQSGVYCGSTTTGQWVGCASYINYQCGLSPGCIGGC